MGAAERYARGVVQLRERRVAATAEEIARSTQRPGPAEGHLGNFAGVGDTSARTWLRNARELSRHFRLAAIATMGGAGKSRPDARYGCCLAQLLHATFPDRVRRIVGLAGTVAAGRHRGSELRQMVHRRRTLTPEEITALRQKSRFLIGDRDLLAYTPESLRALVDNRMNHHSIAGAGHAADVELPDEVNADIINFCRRSVDGRDRGGE